jgi:hypothetical protein
MTITICRLWDLTEREQRTLPKGGSTRVFYLKILWDSGLTEIVSCGSSIALASLVDRAYEHGREDGYAAARADLTVESETAGCWK